jgi:hypothetical protein
MSIEYDLMDEVLDKLIEVRRCMSNDDCIFAAFELGIVHHILQMSIFEDSIEQKE